MATAVRKQLLYDFDQLSPERQRTAADFVRKLLFGPPPAEQRPLGAPGHRAVEQLAGTMSPEDAEEMRQIIEEGCERVDVDGW